MSDATKTETTTTAPQPSTLRADLEFMKKAAQGQGDGRSWGSPFILGHYVGRETDRRG